jgi:hypothetical protein
VLPPHAAPAITSDITNGHAGSRDIEQRAQEAGHARVIKTDSQNRLQAHRL